MGAVVPLGAILVTSVAQAPAAAGRSLPGVFVSHEPQQVAILPESSPGSAELDERDLEVVDEVLRVLSRFDVGAPSELARLPVVEVRMTREPAVTYRFAPIDFASLRTRLRGCTLEVGADTQHPELPGRRFYAVGWGCPDEEAGEQHVTVLAVENHRAIEIYHHSNGVVPVWSPARGPSPGR